MRASGVESSRKVPKNTVPRASDEVSAHPVPSDTQFQLVLRNAHPFQDESLSLTERVNAFKSLQQERQVFRSYWKNNGEKQPCEECGKKHLPPHLNREQDNTIREAYREGRHLCQELKKTSNQPDPSQVGTTKATQVDTSFGGVPSAEKAETVLCTRCASWHPGGAKECKTRFCPRRCGLHHPRLEDCSHAAKRFERLEETNKVKGRNMAPPGPSESTTASDSAFDTDKFATFLSMLPHTEEAIKQAGELFVAMTSKRPAPKSSESSENRKRMKRTG